MNAPSFIQDIEASAIGEWLRSNVQAMPWVNAVHVLCITLVFGSILVVDLRLLGLQDRGRAVTRVSHEMLRFTWTAFLGAVISGGLFFTANASTYWFNNAFRFKMLAILLAGINMLVFQFITYRGVATWDRNALTPGTARLAGALSILIWTTVIVLGRIIGFTKGIEVAVPENMDFDFSGP
ncbi:MAG: DUF6644 family protein [Pseudomonadota bacterium]